MREIPEDVPVRAALMRLGGGPKIGTVLVHQNSSLMRLVIDDTNIIDSRLLQYHSERRSSADASWEYQSGNYMPTTWEDLARMGWEIDK